MLSLILLMGLSAFIIYKLVDILGREEVRGETEWIESITHLFGKKDSEPQKAKDADFEVIPPEEASLPSNIRTIFETLRKEDKGFNAKFFIDGVKKAFEMIVDAVNNYHVDVLKELLNRSLYQSFNSELRKRFSEGPKYEVTLVKIKNVEILDAYIKGEMVYIKVKIDSQQIILTKDKDGKVIDGKADEILDISDIWTFWKEVKGKDYWELVKTSPK